MSIVVERKKGRYPGQRSSSASTPHIFEAQRTQLADRPQQGPRPACRWPVETPLPSSKVRPPHRPLLDHRRLTSLHRCRRLFETFHPRCTCQGCCPRRRTCCRRAYPWYPEKPWRPSLPWWSLLPSWWWKVIWTPEWRCSRRGRYWRCPKEAMYVYSSLISLDQPR